MQVIGFPKTRVLEQQGPRVAVQAALGGDRAVLPGKPAQLIHTWSSRAILAWPEQPVCHCELHSITRWTSRTVLIEQGRKCLFFQLDSKCPLGSGVYKERAHPVQINALKVSQPFPCPSALRAQPLLHRRTVSHRADGGFLCFHRAALGYKENWCLNQHLEACFLSK